MRKPIGFRLRLALFFVGMLIVVQGMTGVLVYGVTRHALVSEGERQLAASAHAFQAQTNDAASRIASNVRIMALDFALRQAIAQGDRGTVLSVLHNHGKRVGAARMQLINLDGSVAADTAATDAAQKAFPFPELIQRAFYRQTAEMVALDDHVYWIVAVPIYAPDPVGLIVVYVPVDDGFLDHMQELSTLRRDVALQVQTAPRQWHAIAQGDRATPFARGLDRMQGELPSQPMLRRISGSDYIVLAQALDHPAGSPAVAVVFGYSLDDALRPYRRLALAWLSLLALELIAGLIGAWLIARNVSRPLESLALAARRIGSGDYSPPPRLARRDEIGELASAIGNMAEAVQQREQRISHQATHDDITGLPNRAAIEAIIASDVDGGAQQGCLAMVGLSRLPEIVKTLGHDFADRLMREAGRRIALVAGHAKLGRAGDGSFVLWLAGADRGLMERSLVRVLDELAQPYREPDISVDMLPVAGLALYPAHAMHAAELLRYAQTAQLAALGAAHPLALYQAASDPHRPERLSLMGELREALLSEQLQLYYQPKLDLATRRIDSAEALIRWQHPQRGMIQPDVFIGMAEDTGNIQRITRWVLAEAVAQTSVWHAQGVPMRVAVNLSPRDLLDPELARYLIELAAAHQLPHGLLTLEVTERAVIHDLELAGQMLGRLSAQGFRIAIDDFGVGQSSLSYLRRLPVHELKIDKTFIGNLANDADNRIIVRSIIELGLALGYKVTAEGVEDEATLGFLIGSGCDYAQGYLLARPLPVTDFVDLLADYADGYPV